MGESRFWEYGQKDQLLVPNVLDNTLIEIMLSTGNSQGQGCAENIPSRTQGRYKFDVVAQLFKAADRAAAAAQGRDRSAAASCGGSERSGDGARAAAPPACVPSASSLTSDNHPATLVSLRGSYSSWAKFARSGHQTESLVHATNERRCGDSTGAR